ncbi:MAG: Dabb family protein [Bacteroidaceae bacterium]|nr:Dabb family protein [Bacteroidaceae bacterium]
MIKHIVMWKLKPEAEGRTAKENALWMKEHLEALLGVVPQLKSCEVGINVKEGNYDACLISTFDSLEDLAAYKVHPEHVKISSYCKLVRENRVACDFVI